MSTKQWQVGIYLYDNVEVLDFAGPFEVLSITDDHLGENKPFKVSTVGETGEMIYTRNQLKILPDYSIKTAPSFDILIIPGGFGTRQERLKPHVLEWIKNQSASAEYVTSVCTGVFLLAELGLLNEKRATTHWENTESLAKHYPTISVLEGKKVVDEGCILTSAGISAGIYMAFRLVQRLLGTEKAVATARYMEYDLDLNQLNDC